MNRSRITALAVMLIAAAVMAATASARHDSSSTLGIKTYKSFKCTAPVKSYDFATWACTTIIAPLQANAGDTAPVTFMFKAKTAMKYVDVCFGQINSAKCAYRHKYVTINKGATVKKVIQMVMPMVSSGTYSLDNYTRFYKFPKNGNPSAYWSARAFMCVVASGDETFQCSLGK